MNNVHPVLRGALAPFAPKTPDQLLAEQLQPYEVDISPSHHAEPIYVTPDPETDEYFAHTCRRCDLLARVGGAQS